MSLAIRIGEERDLPEVAALEKIVEAPNVSASFQLLLSRHQLYPRGFLVASRDERVVGYLESIRCGPARFERFEEVRDFERIYQPQGSVLYIGYLAVDPADRRFGTAVNLMEAAEQLAIQDGMTSMCLVALPKLVPFYRIMGFHLVRTLPDYLPGSAGAFMEKSVSTK